MGEIEADVCAVEGVKTCCCIFIKESKKIVLFYVGEPDKKELTVKMKERLPRYMIPNAIMQVERMPLLPNGKMDRLKMEEMYLSEKKPVRKRKKAKV